MVAISGQLGSSDLGRQAPPLEAGSLRAVLSSVEELAGVSFAVLRPFGASHIAKYDLPGLFSARSHCRAEAMLRHRMSRH